MATFPLIDAELPKDVLIAAALLVAPPFGDLSRWRMYVHHDGTILQEVAVANRSELYESVIVHLQSFASMNKIDQIRTTILSIGIQEYADEYESNWTDLHDTAITTNANGSSKRVFVYGPTMLAREGNIQMIGYLRLWDMVCEIAPYKGTVSEPADEAIALSRIREIWGPIP